jgi:hypothetical protein
MIIQTYGFITSTGDAHYDGMAYVYTTDDHTNYVVSLSRVPDSELVEVMVLDQVVQRTTEVSVTLSRDELRITLSPDVAAALDGETEYIMALDLIDEELQALDAALAVIFEGGTHGRYERRW